MKQWQKNLPSVQSGFQVSLEAMLLKSNLFCAAITFRTGYKSQ